MNIFKQKNIGKQWGTVANVAAQLSLLIAMLNLILLITTAYNTTLSGWFRAYGIPINFVTFVGLIALLLFVAAVLVYKFALPSYFSAMNDQVYRHDNPIRADIERVQKTLDDSLGEIKDRLAELEK